MSLLGKLILGAGIKELVEKAGGVENIVQNATNLKDHIVKRAEQIEIAFNERSAEKGAEVTGEILNDSVTVVTETAKATGNLVLDTYATTFAVLAKAGDKLEEIGEDFESRVESKYNAMSEKSKQSYTDTDTDTDNDNVSTEARNILTVVNNFINKKVENGTKAPQTYVNALIKQLQDNGVSDKEISSISERLKTITKATVNKPAVKNQKI